MFVSMSFLLFLGIVVALFFLLPVKWRPAVLLFGSFLFCGWIELRASVVLMFSSFCTWILGIIIEKALKNGQKSIARVCAACGVCFYIFMLCIYKYLGFILAKLGFEQPGSENLFISLLMPVGLSFYLFQAIGYLIDIYKGNSEAEKNFLYLSLYLAFFPKLVSGPIEREQDFLPQIRELEKVRFKDKGRLSTAFTYMLWGYFMKMVVADRLAVTTTLLFSNPAAYDSFWLLAGAFFYTIQIYCDFSGYSYIAIGCARIFGIRLTHNFETPYMATSISDFWRRWHISLSTWLRDYLYIPLGGNRKGFTRKCINTVIVFLVCGMWHGAGLNFLVWGILHGIYSVIEAVGRKKGWKVKGCRGITFVSVAFAWIFFKASDVKAAIIYIVEMFTSGIQSDKWQQTIEALQLNTVEIVLIIVGIMVIYSVDKLCYRRNIHLPVLIQHKQNAVRYFIFYLLIISILIFGIYGPGFHTEQFIYMQF